MDVNPARSLTSLANNMIGGTRGANEVPGGGSVASGKDGKAGVELPSDPDAQYKKELEVLAEARKEEEAKISDDDVKKFYYASVRSWIVMSWIFSNLSLITLVMKAGSVGIITKTKTSEEEAQRKNSDLYLYIILWSVAGLSAFRFVGSVWFLIHRKVLMFPDRPSSKAELADSLVVCRNLIAVMADCIVWSPIIEAGENLRTSCLNFNYRNTFPNSTSVKNSIARVYSVQ